MSKASIESDMRDYGLSYPVSKQKQTNADRIRAMSDGELVEAMLKIDDISEFVPFCGKCKECDEIMNAGELIPAEMCKQCLVNWLQAEVEEEK